MYILVILIKIKSMVKVNFFGLTFPIQLKIQITWSFTKDLGGVGFLMEKVFIKKLMEIFIQAISKMGSSMEKAIKFLLMEMFIKEII